VAELAAEGARHVRVAPLFLAQGAHLREDVPRLVAATAARHGGLTITLADAAGEAPEVQAALAAYCVRLAAG
jgi:sirohydrochlorin cobaltochelatase